MGRRSLPVVCDFTRDGRWSTHDVSVRKKMGGKMRTDGVPSPTNLAPLGHFPPASQVGCLAGLVFYVYVFSLRGGLEVHMNLMLPRVSKVRFLPIFLTFQGASYGRHKNLPNSSFC
jgi:hypothetical protein